MQTLVTPSFVLAAAVLAGCAGTEHRRTTPDREARSGQGAAASSDDSASAAPTEGQAAQVPTDQPTPGEASTAQAAMPRRGPAPTGLVRSAVDAVRRGQYELAIRQSKSALRRDEKYTPAMEVMARAYYHLRKFEFASAICKIALSINDTSGRCYNLLGFIALKEDDAPRALQQFKKATEVDPNFGPGWLNLGAQYLQVKNYPEAKSALERAADLMGNRADVQLDLGAAYRGAGNNREAEEAFKQALKLRHNYANAYFNLGVLYLDAAELPGMDKTQQLRLALANLNKYKQLRKNRNNDDPVDTYIQGAERSIEHEQRRIERERRRKAREAARKVKESQDQNKGGDEDNND